MGWAVIRRIRVKMAVCSVFGLLGSEALASEVAPAEAAEAGVDRPAPWLMVREGFWYRLWPAGIDCGHSRSGTSSPAPLRLGPVSEHLCGDWGPGVRVSPAFVDGGLLVSLAPIDVFDVDFSVDLTGTWPSSSGQLMYSEPSGKTDSGTW